MQNMKQKHVAGAELEVSRVHHEVFLGYAVILDGQLTVTFEPHVAFVSFDIFLSF